MMQIHGFRCLLRALARTDTVNRSVFQNFTYVTACDKNLGTTIESYGNKRVRIFTRPICTTGITRQEKQEIKQDEKQVAQARAPQGEVTIGAKVVEAGKNVTYAGFVLIAIGIGGVIFYVIGRELFSSQTPQGVYTAALKRCKNFAEVNDELGDPIKGRGEMTRRGRARHPTHQLYLKEGVEHMRMQFYLIGSIRSGTAHVEVRKDDRGKWEYRYLFVEVDSYPYKTIIIEDNR